MGTTQYIDTIEKRIRQHIDVLIKPSFDEDTGFCLNTAYDLTTLEDSDVPESFDLYFYGPEIYDTYDTNQIL